MKRLAAKSGAAAFLAWVLTLSGCGQTNNNGVSVDLINICSYAQGVVPAVDPENPDETRCLSNPEVSLDEGKPLYGHLTIRNRMSDTDATGSDTGLAVHLAYVEVDYRTPTGSVIPLRREQMRQTIPPAQEANDARATRAVPVTLFTYEQMEYIKDNPDLFPALPFQVNLRVTVHYSTTGAATGDVRGVSSLEVVY